MGMERRLLTIRGPLEIARHDRRRNQPHGAAMYTGAEGGGASPCANTSPPGYILPSLRPSSSPPPLRCPGAAAAAAGVVDCVVKTVQAEGPLALYKG